MLLQAPSACTARRLANTVRSVRLSSFFKSIQRSLQTKAGRQMEVLAAAEATSPELEGARLDKALALLFPGRWNSSSSLKRTVRRGEVLVNGSSTKTDHTLQLGDKVEVVIPVGCSSAARQFGKKAQQQQQLPGLDVAYEDDHMAVVVKPQGLLSQGPKGAASVAGRIKYCLTHTPLPGALASPVIVGVIERDGYGLRHSVTQVHRLDVGTGGLMLVAKTRTAATKLSQDLAEHNMQKRYLALVIGRLDGSGIIDHPVAGYPAVSLFRVEGHKPSASFGCLTIVSLWPKTGKTHQLRKHMAYIGHPILGDLQYKHHRKPECKAVLTDISSWLPQAKTSSQRLQMECKQHLQQPLQQGVEPLAHQQEHQDDTEALGHADSVQQKAGGSRGGSSGGGSSAHLQDIQGTGTKYETVVAQLTEPDLPLYRGMGSHHSTQASTNSSVASLDAAAAAAGGGVGGDDGDHNHDQEGSEAADAAGEAAPVGCRQRGQLLKDGSVVGTCLWAVQLQLVHPDTDVHLDISVGDAPARLYDKVCECDAVDQ